MAGQRVGYVRVSTVEQNTERQLDGIELDRVFTDHISGATRNRPALRTCAATCARATPSWSTRWTGWPATSTTYGRWCGSSPTRGWRWSSSAST